jgi:hypothetical protein
MKAKNFRVFLELCLFLFVVSCASSEVQNLQGEKNRDSGYSQDYRSYAPPAQYPARVQPASRFYSNPYAIPATSRYPQYDADQYYVPPTYYRNIEQPNNNSDIGTALSK